MFVVGGIAGENHLCGIDGEYQELWEDLFDVYQPAGCTSSDIGCETSVFYESGGGEIVCTSN